MRINLFSIRLPLAIFLILVLVFSISGYLIIHVALMRNLTEDGNHFYVKTESLEFKFPKGWRTPYPYLLPIWENETVCIIYLFNAELNGVLYLIHYKTRDGFPPSLNLTDEASITVFEVERFYGWIQERSRNATIQFLENGTFIVSNHNAFYVKFQIKDIFNEEDHSFYNITGVFLSSLTEKSIFEILFYVWGDKVWDETYSDFQIILNSLVVKYED